MFILSFDTRGAHTVYVLYFKVFKCLFIFERRVIIYVFGTVFEFVLCLIKFYETQINHFSLVQHSRVIFCDFIHLFIFCCLVLFFSFFFLQFNWLFFLFQLFHFKFFLLFFQIDEKNTTKHFYFIQMKIKRNKHTILFVKP